MDLPAASEAEKRMRMVSLECGSCQTKETVEQSDLESDVYRINEGIVRYCKKCGSSTFWKGASGDVEEAPVMVERVPGRSMGWVPEPEQASAPVAVAARAEPVPAVHRANRRKYVRTKVNFQACIRSFTNGDDIVICVHAKLYQRRLNCGIPLWETARVELAAPCKPGANGN